MENNPEAKLEKVEPSFKYFLNPMTCEKELPKVL
jgi:hypothetical protein